MANLLKQRVAKMDALAKIHTDRQKELPPEAKAAAQDSRMCLMHFDRALVTCQADQNVKRQKLT